MCIYRSSIWNDIFVFSYIFFFIKQIKKRDIVFVFLGNIWFFFEEKHVCIERMRSWLLNCVFSCPLTTSLFCFFLNFRLERTGGFFSVLHLYKTRTNLGHIVLLTMLFCQVTWNFCRFTYFTIKLITITVYDYNVLYLFLFFYNNVCIYLPQ